MCNKLLAYFSHSVRVFRVYLKWMRFIDMGSANHTVGRPHVYKSHPFKIDTKNTIRVGKVGQKFVTHADYRL